ncbi:MAG: signal peptidase II [Phycisphaerales bacterium]|nr:signal peptidase II [Phycisphaerales bacterium]
MTTDSQSDIQRCTSTRSLRAWSILILTSAIGLFIDLWSKSYAFANVSQQPVNIHREDVIIADDLWRLIPPHEPMVVMDYVLEFTLVLNPGAVFGIGAGQRWFFVVFTVIAVIISLVLFVRWTSARDWMAHTGFGLIIAGGLGNLYDRLVYACVRDFIHPLPGVHLPFGLSWPGGSTELWPYVSNIADAFLIVGIIMLMIHAWRMPNESQEVETDQNESAPTTSA